MGPREEFLRHLATERNLSPHTVRAYGGDLDRFIEFVGGEAKLLGPEVNVAIIRRFLSRLHADSYQKSSMARMLACLRTFYDYFLRRGGVETNPVRQVRTPRLDKKLPSFLDEEEVVRLLEATTGDSFTDRRDRALLETIYGGGLRVSEATGLDLVDLQLDQGFAVVRGKGGKERLAPLGTGSTHAIEGYLPERAVRIEKLMSGVDALFINKNGTRLNVHAVTNSSHVLA